jgi:hypothetical protein
VDQKKLEEYLAAHPNALDSSDDSGSSDSDDDESSSVSFCHFIASSLNNVFVILQNSDASGSGSSDDEYVDPHCLVCAQTPFMNRFKQPEKFAKCSTCKNQGENLATHGCF